VIVVRSLSQTLYGIFVVVLLFVLLNSTAEPAHAYVDPGSGLFFLQILGTTFAGMLFILRKKVRNFLRFFGKSSEKVSGDVADQ
jgi:hypothetical protein